MKQKRIICAANWKMNKLPVEATEFMKVLTTDWSSLMNAKEIIIFPTNLCWREVREGTRDLPISWGLQNAHYEKSGAFTGEVSMEMVAELRAQLVLIGHSERRSLFSETDSEISKKMISAQKNGLIPMLCVGESLEERESEQAKVVVERQIVEALKEADLSKPIMIAYEPVWAIGTGKVATPEQAQEMHLFIRELLVRIKNEKFSLGTPILYGGSVKPANAQSLAQEQDIDGFLIGGASLDPVSFKEIIERS